MGEFASTACSRTVVVILVSVLCVNEGNLVGASALLSGIVASVVFISDSGYSMYGDLGCCWYILLCFVVIHQSPFVYLIFI